jgi:O-antigen/teichoic acid export membrane protein
MTGLDQPTRRATIQSVLARSRKAIGSSRSLLSNAGSLFGATVFTVGFGALYWALATRMFPASAVGLAAAAVSAMLLIGQFATFGLGTLLIGELSQHEGSERSLIYSAATIAGVVGALLGAAFIVAASSLVPDLQALNHPAGVVTFAIGVGVTAAGYVLDQAFVGLLRGGLQLLRNIVASIGKLVVLVIVAALGVTLLQPAGASIFLTWVIGGAASMALILAVPRSSSGPARPLWHVPEGLAALAVRHHLFNLSILAPGLLLPLVVTAVMSAEANAYFYIAYMTISLGWALPAALATALYASGARDVEALSPRVRLAFWLCMAAGVALVLFMLVGAAPVLSIFGEAYADRAAGLLRILAFGIFPITINSLYVPIARIERRFLQGTVLMGLGMIIEFIFVIVGAEKAGLDGIGVGWLIGYSLGVVPLIPTVFRVAVWHSVRPIRSDVLGVLPDLARRARSTRAAGAVSPGTTFAAQPVAIAPVAPEAATPRESMEPAAANRSIRFVIRTDGPALRAWQVACVRALLRTPGVSIEAWVQRGTDPTKRSGVAGAMKPVPQSDLPEGLPTAHAAGETTAPGTFDVLLDLSDEVDDEWRRLGAAEAWRFVYGEGDSDDVLRSAMRDVIRGPGVTRVALVALPNEAVLREGALRTAHWSLGVQLDQMLFEPATWPAVVAAARLGAEPGAATIGSPEPALGSPGERRTPGRLERAPVSVLRAGVAARRLAAVRRPLTQHDEWNIGVVRRPIDAFLGSDDLGPVTWLPTRTGRYAADPFGLERDGSLHIMFEDFDLRKGRAVISHATVDANGTSSEPEQVLDPGCHVSYPYLLEADGAVFMIPETADLAELQLYVATDFPRRWRLEATLLKGVRVSDPTVIFRDGRWWLFGTTRGRGVDHALRIWHAPALTGPWTIHQVDPVKVDARSARPGGTPFEVDGRLYRPSQDSSRRYGGRVVVNRIETLTVDTYLERPAAFVGPPPKSAYPDGLHTLSAAGGSTLIDGNAVHFIASVMRAELRERLSRSNPRPESA